MAEDPRFRIEHASFTALAELTRTSEWCGRVAGVLLDLGVSSPQVDTAERGFSFLRDGPLDMRMDRTSGRSAADWLAAVGEQELMRVLKEYGEERYAKRIARALVERRRVAPIVTTGQLAAAIASVVPHHAPGHHPATRSFQAVRIAVNRELDVLGAVLEQVVEVLAEGGRLVVISFHSLEDRIVKRFMRDESRSVPRSDWPGAPAARIARLHRVGGPVRPTAEEARANPRSRSAILRVAERLAR